MTLVKSTQYKKLAPNSKIKFENLKSCKPHEKRKHQNARSTDEKLKTKGLMFIASFFSLDILLTL